MNHNDQVWEEYLSMRPNLNKWYSHCEQLGSHRTAILKDKVMNGGETEYGRKVAGLDDGEALAYFVYLDRSDNDLLINSKAVKHVQPSISLVEAEYATTQNWSYIHLLCSRELGGPFLTNESLDNMDFIDNLLQTINDYRIYKFHHIVWNTEHDLVKTVVRYKNYRDLFKVDTDSDILIDSDFLDDYLLADKPDPIEIDRNTWHDMAVRLIEKLDDENNRIRMEHTNFLGMEHMNFLGFVSTGLVSCFLTRNVEELAFMESVYDFCVSARLGLPYTKRAIGRNGILDPKIFDMFREYGASFARPLLESVLSE